VYAPPTHQTVASLQSMLRSARRPAFSVENGELRLLPASDVKRQDIPGLMPTKALRVGAGEATFFLDDPRVRNCETWFANPTVARMGPYFGMWSRLSKLVPGQALDEMSDALTLKFKKDPPAEDRSSSRFVVTAEGDGGGRRVRVVLDGTSCYELTGFLSAVAAEGLLAGKARRFGYVSLPQAFGARPLLSRLEGRGTKATVEVDGRREDRGSLRQTADSQAVGARA
jgi:hypothetical protein